MERRKHYYVNVKSLWVKLVCLALALAAAFCIQQNIGAEAWLLGGGGIVYVLIALLSGDELLHRTAVPVWFMALGLGLRTVSWIHWAILVGFCLNYTLTFSGRGGKWTLAILEVLGAILLVLRGRYPEAGFVLGMFLLLMLTQVHTDGKYHPTWGDRIEGRRVRTAPAMEQITAYFMPDRTGANNLFSAAAEITAVEKYVRQKRKNGLTGFGITHVIMAAYVRTVAKYPGLNRFIAGQRIYSRGEDVTLCMTVKKELTATAPDSLVKVHLHPGDTAEDVYRKFNEQVELAKNEMENTTADNTAANFMRIPGLLLKGAIWLLKTLDYFGLIPRFLLEVSPFHGSVYFTSMGSLGIRPVYHHLYDFGTVPVFCSFGRKRREQEMVNGEWVERKYVDLKFNLDERICDGFYYASVLKYFLRLLSHPEVLDTPPETVEQDIP